VANFPKYVGIRGRAVRPYASCSDAELAEKRSTGPAHCVEERASAPVVADARPAVSGFTLMELLTAIAIIGILASLLLPSLSKSKERARITQCLSNLHQVSVGMRMYASDDNDLYPLSGDEIPWDMIDNRTHRTGWMQQILDQVANKEVFRCPSDRRSLYSYFNGARAAYLVANRFAALDSRQIRFHSAYVLSGDAPWYDAKNNLNDADKDDYNYNCVGGKNNGTPAKAWQMHNRGQNLLFEDGHARWYQRYMTNEMTFRYESIHGWK
jgi:prepilin-type N-terminal cleavage/methylation domain-containing protein